MEGRPCTSSSRGQTCTLLPGHFLGQQRMHQAASREAGNLPHQPQPVVWASPLELPLPLKRACVLTMMSGLDPGPYSKEDSPNAAEHRQAGRYLSAQVTGDSGPTDHPCLLGPAGDRADTSPCPPLLPDCPCFPLPCILGPCLQP